MKVFYLFNHPAPYKIDFYNELGKYCDLTAIFSRDEENGTFKRNPIFYSHKAENFNLIMAHAKEIGDLNCWSTLPVKHLKKNKYDVIVINGYSKFVEMHVISYLRRKHIPYIIEINGGIIAKKESKFKKWLKTHYLKGANAYLAPDNSSAEYLCYYGAKKENIFIYPYSSVPKKDLLHAPLTKEEKEAIREKYGFPKGILYASCGFFYPRKNFVRLVEIFAKLQYPCSLLLIGEGEEKEAIQRKIEELHLSNVKIIPFMENEELLHVLSCVDAFLFLSKEDIYGHVIVEAFSQGIPIVSSSGVNAAKHLIQNGVNGYIVDNEDEESILQAFKDVLNPEFPKKALEVAENFIIEEEASFHHKFFLDFLKKKEEKR